MYEFSPTLSRHTLPASVSFYPSTLMQSSTALLCALLYYFLLHITNVYGACPYSSKASHSSTTSTRVDPVELTGTSVFKSKCIHNYTLDDKYSYYFYHVNDDHKHVLKYPNRLNLFRFNDKSLEFSDSAQLPKHSFSSLDVLTYNSSNPVLLRVHGQGLFYFYSPDPKTKKWTNKTFDHLKRFEREDSNGVKCYKFESADDYKSALDTLSAETSSLSDQLFKSSESSDSSVKNTTLEFYVDSVKTSSKHKYNKTKSKYSFKTKSAFQDTLNSEFLYSLFYVSDEDRHSLKHPHALKELKFDDLELNFEESSLLPTSEAVSLHVFSCKSGAPFLVRLQTSSGSYYYSQSSDSSKWTNFSLSELTSLEKTDSNGAKYYHYTTSSDFKKFLDALTAVSSRLSSRACKVHRSEKSSSKDSSLEVKVRLFDSSSSRSTASSSSASSSSTTDASSRSTAKDSHSSSSSSSSRHSSDSSSSARESSSSRHSESEL